MRLWDLQMRKAIFLVLFSLSGSHKYYFFLQQQYSLPASVWDQTQYLFAWWRFNSHRSFSRASWRLWGACSTVSRGDGTSLASPRRCLTPRWSQGAEQNPAMFGESGRGFRWGFKLSKNSLIWLYWLQRDFPSSCTGYGVANLQAVLTTA